VLANRHKVLFGASLLVMFFAGCGSTGPSSPFVAEACPANPDLGYPVSVEAVGQRMELQYLNEVADAFARRWLVPSRRRRNYVGAESVKTRLATPEPMWAADWRPGAHHTAEVHAALDPQTGALSVVSMSGSGDSLFDDSLQDVFSDEPGWTVPVPLPSGGKTGLLSLVVRFGNTPPPGAGLSRFAVHQRPLRGIPGTARIEHPRGAVNGRAGKVTVTYDVAADGSLVPSTLKVIRSDGDAFSRGVLQGMRTARFRPAESNCRAVAQTAIQVIEFGAIR